jgi:hypothetical protein
MSKRRDKDSVYSFPSDLHTQAPKERLSGLAAEYLEAMRPYLDQRRELAELSEDNPTEAAQIQAGEARLLEFIRRDERERTYDAIDETLSLDAPKNDCDFLIYELLRQSANPDEEWWVLTEWEERITSPLPASLRHLIEQAVARSPELRHVADRAHWLDRQN